MGKRQKSKGTLPRFSAIYEWEMELPAYRHLSVYGRALLLEFRIIYNLKNNGKICMSVRRAAELLGCGKNKAEKVLAELQDKGWIVLTSKGSFSQKTDKTASTWRITNQPVGLGVDVPATKEYTRWLPPKIQNTVPSGGTACPSTGDRGTKSGPSTGDRTPPNCPSTGDRDTSKTPLHGTSEGDTCISTTGGRRKRACPVNTKSKIQTIANTNNGRN